LGKFFFLKKREPFLTFFFLKKKYFKRNAWFGISARVWDFGRGLGFRQGFGISAGVWDFGKGLGFGFRQSAYAKICLGFGI